MASKKIKQHKPRSAATSNGLEVIPTSYANEKPPLIDATEIHEILEDAGVSFYIPLGDRHVIGVADRCYITALCADCPPLREIAPEDARAHIESALGLSSLEARAAMSGASIGQIVDEEEQDEQRERSLAEHWEHHDADENAAEAIQ